MGGAVNKKNKKKYERIIPIIGYYLKSKNITRNIFKEKCPLFAASGNEGRINLFSNSLEQMGYFSGHKMSILCLCAISNKIFASGSEDKTIKIWNIEDRSIISTTTGHTEEVFALCYVKEGVFMSGSVDRSLIIWSKSTPKSSIYSPKQTLTGHKSPIIAIIRLNNGKIVSGEADGDLRMWDIDQGLCITYIPSVCAYGDYINQMKQNMRGDVVVSYRKKVMVWGAANHLENIPFKQFDVCEGESIEFLSENLLLRGGHDGQLEFIDYAQTGCKLSSIRKRLHSYCIFAIQRIAKNIVITASDDGYLKVIHPIFRRCYMKYKGSCLYTLAYFY